MKERKTRVFMTGATGVMGMAGLKEFEKFPEDYQIKVLARDSKVNRKKLKHFSERGIEVVWGDLLDEKSLRQGIESSDIVLHIGGLVSPKADLYPEQTMKVNVGSMRLIAEIVKKIETGEPGREIKVVYIGSVSQYGSRKYPDIWGKVGDRMNPAKKDAYALSKVKAEEELKSAKLKKWVSIRQTSILHEGLLKNASNPVVFHTPLQGVLEWITTEDSGRLLERICREDVPADFWCKSYNAGGGELFRKTNLEFERVLLKALGCPPPEKIFETNWFATENFHGMWFEDSDYLDQILHYRSEDNFEAAIERIKKKVPVYFKLAPIVPWFVIKKYMKWVASRPDLGPLSWIRNNDRERIEISWGGLDSYNQIPKWNELEEIKLDRATPKKEKFN